MSRQKVVDNREILQHLADKYYGRSHHYVFRLSYGEKCLIVKGKTLSGALFLIKKGFEIYTPDRARKDMLYWKFFNHVLKTPGKRFRVRILMATHNPYRLLKREQNELDKAVYDKSILNSNKKAYIPQYRKKLQAFGWIDRAYVLNFWKYLKSDQRKRVLSQNKLRVKQAPAKRV